MRAKTIINTFTLTIIAIISACTQPSSNNKETQLTDNKELSKINSSFFDKYKIDEKAAIDYLFGKSNELNPEQIKSKLESVKTVYGKYTGFVKITEKGINNSLVLTSFLVKYEKQPLRFTIIYYKPKDTWMLYKFQIDEDTLSEIEDSAKIFIIN